MIFAEMLEASGSRETGQRREFCELFDRNKDVVI